MNGLLREPRAGARVARREPLEAALVRLGVRRLRPGQDRAIAAGLAGRDALVVMATGSGKSLCYQAPAATLPGLTVVVSPLIALMADQLAGLDRAGIAAAALNSDMPEEAQREALERARSGELALLYVAPERFGSAAFLSAIDAAPVSLLVIDEAHWSPSGATSSAPTTPRGPLPRAPAASGDDGPHRDRDRAGPGRRRAVSACATGWSRRRVRPAEPHPRRALGRGRSGARKRRRAARRDRSTTAQGDRLLRHRKASEETAAFLEAAGHPAVAYHAGRADRAEARRPSPPAGCRRWPRPTPSAWA